MSFDLKLGSREKAFTLFAFIVSVAVLALAVIRAIRIPLTHDEATTLKLFVPLPVFDIIGYVNTYGMPNNHIMNTLLMKFFGGILGHSTLALRIPNILALALYLYAGNRLFKELRSDLLRIAGFLLLIFNPFVFEFFALARGYGLANGFMLYTLLRLFYWTKTPSTKNVFLLFIFTGLTVLSNFTTIHFLFALLIVYIFLYWRNVKPHSFSDHIRMLSLPFIFSVIMGIVLFEPFRRILKWKSTSGGHTGLWFDCIAPVIRSTSYSNTNDQLFITTTSVIVIICFLLISVLFIYALFSSVKSFATPLFLICSLPLLLIQAQHFFMHTDYPFARAFQFAYPLFILALIFTFDSIPNLKRTLSFFTIFLCPFLIFQFFRGMKEMRTLEWRFDASNRTVLRDIEQELKKEGTSKPIHLGITWVMEPGLNYEIQYAHDSFVSPVTRNGVDSTYDLYYVTEPDSAKLAQEGKQLIKSYPVSRTSLFK